ncbi:RNA helicase required for poly(A+) mRNA export [Rhizophlyctis rosea]|uniref:RNA helicase required for poly(A+) mRNA export n=1 Tax=Rhizophlyctis rosea TaxID=64517 RepID=A0AAD5X4X1_9FUNG|nr:RNA helicase required for poly(A+) mRNA export [Rhizophlyctis rosea]
MSTLPLPIVTTSSLVDNAGGVEMGSSPTAEEKGLEKVMADLSKKLPRRQAPEELVQWNILLDIVVDLTMIRVAWKRSMRREKIKAHVVNGKPGTGMDLMRKNQLPLNNIRIFVLDDTDNMLDQ